LQEIYAAPKRPAYTSTLRASFEHFQQQQLQRLQSQQIPEARSSELVESKRRIREELTEAPEADGGVFAGCRLLSAFAPVLPHALPENAALKAKLECSQRLIERIELEQQQLRTALHHAVKEVSELKNRSRVAGAEAVQVIVALPSDTVFLWPRVLDILFTATRVDALLLHHKACDM
jgi:hypothetical protein